MDIAVSIQSSVTDFKRFILFIRGNILQLLIQSFEKMDSMNYNLIRWLLQQSITMISFLQYRIWWIYCI